MPYSDTIYLVKNDTLPALTFTLTDASTELPIDLTGAVVVMRIRNKDLDTEKAAITCVPLAPAAGTVVTNFPGGTLDEAGTFDAEIEVTFSDQSVQTVYNYIKLVVRNEIG
jgi:hypothetical protein